MSRLSTVAVSTFVPALNVLSTTLPESTFLSLVRTKAPPLPGLTCWNSTTDHNCPSRLSTRPFLRSFVVATICLVLGDVDVVVPGHTAARERPGVGRPCYRPGSRDPSSPRARRYAPGVSEPADDASSTAWLARVRALQAIAQEGLTYARNPFDTARYARLKEVTADIAGALDAEGTPGQLRLAVEQADGYLTPKLDVRAAVFDDDGRVLLVRELRDRRWSLPGGWADVGEGIAAGAVREVREESGYVVEYERLFGVYDRERWGHPPMSFYTLKAVVGCRVVGGEATTSSETDGVEWFDRVAVPELSVGRTSARLLERAFEHHDDASLPPDID